MHLTDKTKVARADFTRTRSAAILLPVPLNSNRISKLLQVDLSAKDISLSHRLSPASESNRQPTIIARFCSRRIRDAVFNNRHRLRAHNKDHPKARIFINESLTKINRRRFNQCLRFKKENNLKFIWTKNGITYLRKDEGTPAFAIKNESDLVRHGIVAS